MTSCVFAWQPCADELQCDALTVHHRPLSVNCWLWSVLPCCICWLWLSLPPSNSCLSVLRWLYLLWPESLFLLKENKTPFFRIWRGCVRMCTLTCCVWEQSLLHVLYQPYNKRQQGGTVGSKSVLASLPAVLMKVSVMHCVTNTSCRCKEESERRLMAAACGR